MVIFKEKKSRVASNKSDLRVTLDAKHSQKIRDFKQATKNISKNKKKLASLNSTYTKLSQIPNNKLNTRELEEKLSIKEEISKLTKDIKNIEKNKSLNKYLLDTSHMLYQYYDNSHNHIKKPKFLKKFTNMITTLL